MKYHGKELIAFFKGTAGEFLKLGPLAPLFMAAAADMRNHVSPIQLTDLK
jgi:hypothetical protein